MRLRSRIWVQSYLWRCGAEGAPGVVVRRGDEDAGVIYIKVNGLDGTLDLYGPAISGSLPEDGERRWSLMKGGLSEADADALLARQISFDRDCWVLEVEDRRRRHFLDDWLSPD